MAAEPTLLQRLSAWTSAIRAEELPPRVIETAALCFLDYIGAALRADSFGTQSTREGADQILALMRAEGQNGEHLVLGRAERLNLTSAVLMNAYLGQSTSLDDTALRSMSHPGCAVIPAVLGIAAERGSSGSETIAAIVAGYEAMIRVGRAIMPGHAKRGFHVTATTAPFGAAAAAARLMRLDAEKTTAALAVAGDLGAGLQEALFRSYAAGKLAVARSVQAGVIGARLAAEGMPGAPAFLEGPEGFLRAMTDDAHPGLVCQGLGEEFEIAEIGVKFHSGCRHWHAAADAVIEMRKTQGLAAGDVARIQVSTYGEALRMNIDAPPSGDQARLSTPFALAQALLGCDLVTGDLFNDTELFRPEVQRLMQRVTHALDPSFERRYPMEWPVRVEVQTTDGRTLTATRDGPRGEPGAVTPDASTDKFIAMASPVLGEAAAQGFAEGARTLMKLDRITPLLGLLGRTGGVERKQEREVAA